MVGKSFDIFKQQLSQYQAQALGHALSEAELSTCYKQIRILKPSAGKQFWRADGQSGLYIVLAGKARLLDSADNLIASIGTEESFGETGLFPAGSFLPHAS